MDPRCPGEPGDVGLRAAEHFQLLAPASHRDYPDQSVRRAGSRPQTAGSPSRYSFDSGTPPASVAGPGAGPILDRVGIDSWTAPR